METLKNYLENMFLNLPNTPEIRKAKGELLQMMEDKYTELKSEGKAENEAIGIVISEFGNLDELADELGIKAFVEEEILPEGMLSLDNAKVFLKDTVKRSQLIAMGVLLCIISPVPVIFMDAFTTVHRSDSEFVMTGALSICFMFLLIAIAVVLFIFAGTIKGKWQKIYKGKVGIDFHVTGYTKTQFEGIRSSHAICLGIGCMFCILSVIPEVIIGVLLPTDFWGEFSGGGFLILVAIGVYLIVFTNVRSAGYRSLLSLNAKGTIGNAYVPEGVQRVEYTNETFSAIMSVYWQTITCIYLCISFITFDWHITWVIWPVAAILHSILKTSFQKL